MIFIGDPVVRENQSNSTGMAPGEVVEAQVVEAEVVEAEIVEGGAIYERFLQLHPLERFIRVWQFDDPGDVKGILTEDITNNFDKTISSQGVRFFFQTDVVTLNGHNRPFKPVQSRSEDGVKSLVSLNGLGTDKGM